MSDYIIEMRNITKSFPGVVANNDVSIAVKQGEIYALLGENGAGKSTLMSILFGMYEPDTGEIFLRGEKVRIESPSQASKLSIGMVHQHFKLVQNYTIAENIIMGVEPIKKMFGVLPFVDLKSAKARIRELSEKYGLGVDPDMRINQVDVSTQQRVEILKMLYREAEILIFDEPTAVLTPQEIDTLLSSLRSLQAGGKTIILITHKLDEIKRIATRSAVMRKGELVGVLDVASATTTEMAQMMVGREVVFEVEKAPADFGEEVLKVQDLCVRVKGVEHVKKVSFSVRRGEIFAIAGVSGNGQIEIAEAITGLGRITSGAVYLNGEPVQKLTIRQRTLKGISYIPEDRQAQGLILDFNLSQNLALKTYFKDDFNHRGILQNKRFTGYAKELIERYDIRSGQGPLSIVRSMSGGNQQKAIVAREIELGSDLMIFVQPTRGLDIGAIENIHRKIFEERGKGKAILLISLELDEIMSCADTIGVVFDGEMISINPRENLDVSQVGMFMGGVV